MKVKWGALVVDGRNKIGGHVASRNAAGAYFRTKVTPVNPATTYQQSVRNRLSGLSSAWGDLTAAQRAAWNQAVILWQLTDIFGDIKTPSGFNLFQRLNNNLLNIGKAQIDVPPAPAAVDALTSLSIAAAAGAGTLTITYAPAIEADHSFLVRATPALSPGIGFVKSEFRQIDVMVTADASPFSIETEYETKFGDIGPAGMQIFLQMIGVNWDTGQQGIPLAASCIIAA
jgi:hypothetical protein